MGGQTWLVLEDGSTFAGRGFAYPAPFAEELQPSGYVGIGEIVFNTAMLGYHEVLTDPSYTGQLVSMTYPHIGNYGISEDWNESGPSGEAGSDPRPVKIAGFVLRSLYRGPVPLNRKKLEDYLYEHSIPGITELDTRRLTLLLRDRGSVNAALLRSKNAELHQSETEAALKCLKAFPSMAGRNLVSAVGSSDTIFPPAGARASEGSQPPAGTRASEGSQPPAGTRASEGSQPPAGKHVRFVYSNIALYDCGIKANIIRMFEKIGCSLSVYPSASTASDILAGGHDAVMVSNGPGDPSTLSEQILTVKKLIGNIPVFGICLGHQLIAAALEARTYKMKFGHHGINHPVRDERTGRVFVTSQNHGFVVDEDSLPASVEVWFRNANDKSIEGIRDDARAVLSTQFHPESAPGPYDSHWLFEEFLRAIPGQEEN